MNDTRNLPATVNPNLPAYMQTMEVDKDYQQHLQDYIVPPMLKIIQPTYQGDDFAKGDVILSPQKVVIDKTFYFTPLFFYPEWLYKNPNGIKPFIIERSYDTNSECAVKSRQKSTWSHPHPSDTGDGKKMCRYDEHLNFVCMIEGDHELKGTPVIISFACGEFKTGRSLMNTLAVRKTPQPYCNRFQAKVVQRDNEGHTYGLDISAPEDGQPWVDEETVLKYGELATALKASKDKLRASYDDLPEVEPTGPTEPAEY